MSYNRNYMKIPSNIRKGNYKYDKFTLFERVR